MKLGRKEKNMLLVACGIVLVAVAYLFVFRRFSDENITLENKNATLSNQVAELELLNNRKEEYTEVTTELENMTTEIVEQFPSEIREETAIMYAYDMENSADIHLNAMTIEASNLLYTMGQSNTSSDANTASDSTASDSTASDSTNGSTTEGNVNSDTAAAQVRLYTKSLNISYTVSYNDFKKIVEYIQTNADKRNVESVSVSYDSDTGKLVGTMVLNLFYLRGSDNAYSDPYIPSMQHGNTNPFGTVESSNAGGTADVEDTAD